MPIISEPAQENFLSTYQFICAMRGVLVST